MYQSLGESTLIKSLSKAALTQPAVPSGRKDILSPPLSSKVYISLLTMSVDWPTPLENNSVFSIKGNLISL